MKKISDTSRKQLGFETVYGKVCCVGNLPRKSKWNQVQCFHVQKSFQDFGLIFHKANFTSCF